MSGPGLALTVFTKNRDRLLNHATAHSFFARVVERASPLMSHEHFTVDGTLIEAWASHKTHCTGLPCYTGRLGPARPHSAVTPTLRPDPRRLTGGRPSDRPGSSRRGYVRRFMTSWIGRRPVRHYFENRENRPRVKPMKPSATETTPSRPAIL